MSSPPSFRWWLVGATCVGAGVALISGSACSASSNPTSGFGSGGGSQGSHSTGSNSDTGGGGGLNLGGHKGPFTDFPKNPVVVDPTLPGNIGSIFGSSPGATTGGPCLTEPAMDAMVPNNWTPLLFEWVPATGENVFELRLHVKNQTNDLVVYTSQSTYVMDATVWKAFSSDSSGSDVEVTLRGAVLMGNTLMSGPNVGVSGTIHIAPVGAPGSVVYWTSSNGTAFQGFSIGDPTSVTVLTPAIAGATSTGSTTTCISCHTSSPDGNLVVYTRDSADGTRAVDIRNIDGTGAPAANVVSPAALALLGREKTTAPILSKAHYSANDSTAVAVFVDPTLTANHYELAWYDLHTPDASGWGVLPRNGDTRDAASPAFRHDGTAIAYVSAPTVGEGVIADGGDFDIYVVPFNNRMGGTATPLAGASDPNYREFYPVYSPDDTLVAFNRTDQPVNSYNQPSAELCIVPAGGGTATRLTANDPPACSGLVSPGLTNSWSRWAPSAAIVGNLRYYWLVFSSKRHAASNDGMGNLLPQLYVAAIVTKIDGSTETLEKEYPAVYVASQNPTQNNHTPAWDVFDISKVPPVQ